MSNYKHIRVTKPHPLWGGRIDEEVKTYADVADRLIKDGCAVEVVKVVKKTRKKNVSSDD